MGHVANTAQAEFCQTLTIDGRRIGPGERPYIIAELSGNHQGSLERACALIDVARRAGADAVKIQTYTADTLTLNHAGEGFVIDGGLWHGRTLYDLYQEAHTPWEWHAQLFEYARHVGMTLFSTPFDHTAVNLLERLGAPAYKIASFEALDFPLMDHIIRTGKPVIVSTGMLSLEEMGAVVRHLRHVDGLSTALLHCISGYPTPAEEANLRTLQDMRTRFGTIVGLSDHTLGTAVSVAAVALGASIIEKHVTLCRADGGPDAAFSLEPDELVALCQDCGTAWQAMGTVSYALARSEQHNIQFRRSLYAVADIEAGEQLTMENIRSIRPGYGLAPRLLPDVLGRYAREKIFRGTPLRMDLLQ